MRFGSSAGKARVRPVATSTTSLLRELEIHDQGLQLAAKAGSQDSRKKGSDGSGWKEKTRA